MTNALMKRPSGSGGGGVLPAVASAVVPGLGQLINGESDKALGVFAVWFVSTLGFIGAIPLLGSLAGMVGLGTWVYSVVDGYATGKKKR